MKSIAPVLFLAVALVAGLAGCWRPAATGSATGPAPAVWVGPVERPEHRRADPDGPRVLREYRSEGGRLAVTQFDEDGNSVEVLVDPEVSKDRPAMDAVEQELERAAQDVRATSEKVGRGWVVKGAAATRALDREGRGVQAATFRFSPEAREVSAPNPG
jgi:hypothetical protein